MSTTPNLTVIKFSYIEMDSKNGPPFIRVKNNTREEPVIKNGPRVPFDLKAQPPISNGIFELIFNPDFYPLNIYCDGQELSILVQGDNGEMELLIPFNYSQETVIKVFSRSGENAPGEVRINIEDTSSESEIGIVIVGTSGLSVPGI